MCLKSLLITDSGNWRKESYTAPSLLTKSCHDIDWLLWMLSTPTDTTQPPHLPSSVTTTGARTYFRRARKPPAAGDATNCLSCPIERNCIYSAKRIYVDQHLKAQQNTGWPVKIVVPDIEDCGRTHGAEAVEAKLLAALAEDYSSNAAEADIEARPWFGRCVWESDNDVCDDQTVTITWNDDLERGRGAKSATLHMVAWSRAQCDRRGRIYGTTGEISYDGFTIEVDDFITGKKQTYSAGEWHANGHGGGDAGLTAQFVKAIEAVKPTAMNGAEANGASVETKAAMSVEQAQVEFIGCTLEDAFRSHAVVFAAEDARHQARTLDWAEWWRANVENAGDGA